MTFTTFLIKFIAIVACALFGAAFAADMMRSFKTDKYGEFGLSLVLTVGFITGLIRVLCM